MFKGGISFNKKSHRSIQYIALLGTPIYAGYNMLVYFGIAQSTNYTGDVLCLLISALWVVVGIFHFFIPIRSKGDIFVRLFAYQALSYATLMFITGFNEPFASSITLLFLAANVYFGRNALYISMFSLIAVAALDAYIRFPYNPSIITENALGVGGILVLGIATVGVVIAQETRREALVKSQAQEALQRDRILTIINNLTDATLSTDKRGVIRLYNAAALNLLDTNGSLKGKNLDDILHLVDTEGKKVSLLNELLGKSTKVRTRDDLNHSFSDGESIRLEVTYAPIRSSYSSIKKSETHEGYIVIMRDVTKAKSLEEERDEFISVVSHELRTPITIVEGSLSNMQVMIDHPDATPEMIKDGINVAHDQITYLAKMVNDLSTLSRAERGVSDEKEDIDVRDMINKLHEEYDRVATAKGLHLNLDLGVSLGYVSCSRLYLEEMLQNFITNAIKYTKTGSVTVKVKQKLGIIKFSISDTGIGISKPDQAKIFQKFYRSEDYRTRETSGTGLGLYVTAKLAHKIGAKIELTSRLNHGSTFSFSLPMKKK